MSQYKLPEIKKNAKHGAYKSINIRINDEKIRQAIKTLNERHGISSQKLVLGMIEHCLKDAGFLK